MGSRRSAARPECSPLVGGKRTARPGNWLDWTTSGRAGHLPQSEAARTFYYAMSDEQILPSREGRIQRFPIGDIS